MGCNFIQENNMRRFWVTPKWLNQKQILISGDDFHHIFEVCRFFLNDPFELLGVLEDQAVVVKAVQVGKKQAIVEVISSRKIPKLDPPFIHLVLSLPRPNTFDQVVEKMVELGVKSLSPITSKFSYFKKGKSLESLEQRHQRLLRIIHSASAQSGRVDLLEVKAPSTLEQKIEEWKNLDKSKVGFVPYENYDRIDEKSARSLKHQISYGLSKSPKPHEVWIFIGSEGGWHQNEIFSMEKAGILPVGLGSQVLRVEIACVVTVACLKYELELW